jgi:hypothetical protein
MWTYKKGCLHCSEDFYSKSKHAKYCSNRCQVDYQHKEYISKWRAGLVDGKRGKKAPLISNHLRRYLIEVFGERCSACGWDRHHSKTGRVPLEVNHKDGNAENNSESNLELLCPNCHSLTDNFRNLNRGNGREYRRMTASKE